MNLPIAYKKVAIYIKPEYLNHKYISGNKLRKLKYNLIQAKQEGFDTLLTFGGAFSNHIAAVAAAGEEYGLKTIGVIRGEELALKINDNPTLSFAASKGMEFKFVTRSAYRQKTSQAFIAELKEDYGAFYLVPEGGTNALAVKGCEEILTPLDVEMDYICCPVGTGGTISGLINASKNRQKVLGFPALKGDFLSEDICKFAQKENWELITDYHFGGYAKINLQLISFINKFKQTYGIPLDPVYTGKMMYGLFDLIDKGAFSQQSKILAIHTGGLQGIPGMNKTLKQKKLPLIQ
ncbi:MAG: 1-aminocyclopropane-1-carboxylate deaminase/D-cysteine desulfhydrase [Algicola sp.]|nr:1-aminocyclopropane-1-carboxylate deaminase/D-cysteine desulfhydrase [Algicola sp.]